MKMQVEEPQAAAAPDKIIDGVHFDSELVDLALAGRASRKRPRR